MEPSSELLRIAEAYFAAGRAGARAWRDQYVDDVSGLRVIGTDAAEWFAGSEAFEIFDNDDAHMDEDTSVTLCDGEAFVVGDVGWAAGQPQAELPGGGVVSLRWTGVFERVSNKWRLRQMHVSRP